MASLQPLSSFSTLQVLVEGVASNKQVLQNGRPDHVTYRMYLWKCMCQFSSLAESKSKIIVPLLYQFIEYVLVYSIQCCVYNSFVYMYMYNDCVVLILGVICLSDVYIYILIFVDF